MPGLKRTANLLLGALSNEDFALLKPHFAEVRLVQKAVLQEAGSPIRHAYFPVDGMISLLATFDTGEAIEIAAIGREVRSAPSSVSSRSFHSPARSSSSRAWPSRSTPKDFRRPR
jgi:hypothetical protein